MTFDMQDQGIELEVAHLSLAYSNTRGELQVLNDLSVKVESGQTLAICGRSGVGKSSLIRAIAGLNKVKSGEVLFDGVSASQSSANLGFVTQDYSKSLFPWLTVAKNVALPFAGKDVAKSAQIERVKSVLEEVGLADKADSYPWQLSGGMQQRVVIARALVANPRLLLLDEPFASIDIYVRLELEELVLKIIADHKITTLIVTHDVEEAIYMSDRVIILGGSPAAITFDSKVALGYPRNQIDTRSSSEFLQLRAKLHEGLK
jgi:NitT/TauT family transport system ATP-binding protein